MKFVLNGCSMVALAYVCDELGCDETGVPIDLVIGSLTMKEWNVTWDTARNTLDFSRIGQTIVEFWDSDRVIQAA